MRIVDLIEKKRKGKELSKEEIQFWITNYINGEIPDYQISPLLMAICLKGMSDQESVNLTLSMMNSGDVIDLSSIEGIKVDKHSTGGVGDKTSLIIGPIVSSLGVVLSKMSGQGLGFTGGTLDKLESIPNFNINLSDKQFKRQLKDINIAIIGQSKNLVPADKKLYALRDVTGTVESIPLITSSIMSKKLATGADTIILDIKVGDGAFMKNINDAKKLVSGMINISQKLNKDVRAYITNMKKPLGRMVGNKNEVLEVLDFFNGEAPNDLVELVEVLSSTILVQAKKAPNEKEAIKMVRESITSGKAFNKFKEWIKYQGGDIDLVLSNKFWKPKHKVEILAPKSGYAFINTSLQIGLLAMKLGAGRESKADVIDYEAGIKINKKSNEKVIKGQPVLTLYSSKPIPQNLVEDAQKTFDINKKQVKIKVIYKKYV